MTTIAQYIARFRKAEATVDTAIVTRIRAVNGMRTEHDMKAADVSRRLFDVPAEAKLTSRETAPVSHASTVLNLATLITPTGKAYESDYIVRALFTISTGKVPAATAKAAAETLATEWAENGGNLETLVSEMVATLTAPKTRKVGGNASGKAKADKAPAETVTVVATPATLPELLAELESQLLAITDLAARTTYVNKVANLVQRHRAMIDQSRTEKATAAVKAPAKAKAKVAA